MAKKTAAKKKPVVKQPKKTAKRAAKKPVKKAAKSPAKAAKVKAKPKATAKAKARVRVRVKAKVKAKAAPKAKARVKVKAKAAKPAARKAAPSKVAPKKPAARKAVARKPVKKAVPVKKAAPVRKAAPVKAAVPVKKAVPAAPARKLPSLDRERRVMRESDMVPTPPSSLVPQRHASAASSGNDEMRVRLAHNPVNRDLAAGDPDVDSQGAETVGDEAPGGDNPTPDQDVVEEIGKALGVQYDDDEELRGGDEIADRDHDRWELDPASSEDFEDR